MLAEHKISRWQASDTVAVDTNWFSAGNIAPSKEGTPSKFTVQILMATTSVVEFDITDGTTNKTGKINNGGSLIAAVWYQFDVELPAGYTFNIQHKTTTQNMACHIFETLSNAEV